LVALDPARPLVGGDQSADRGEAGGATGAGLTPMSAAVLVTGTAGGVGSVAVAILRHRVFTVTAPTRQPGPAHPLKGLGGHRHHRTQRAPKTAGKRALDGRSARPRSPMCFR